MICPSAIRLQSQSYTLPSRGIQTIICRAPDCLVVHENGFFPYENTKMLRRLWTIAFRVVVVQADAAILVVAAPKKEFDSGFGSIDGPTGAATAGSGGPDIFDTGDDAPCLVPSGGQTRESALLLHGLGVSNIIVAVNKMDQVCIHSLIPQVVP